MKPAERALIVFAAVVFAAGIATCALVVPAIAQHASGEPRTEIDDPAELTCFLSAEREADNAAKAFKLESFLQQYPNSAAKEDALEHLLDTYEQLGNLKEVEATAGRLLQRNPGNLSGLWARAKLFPYTDTDQPDSYQESADIAKRGLRVLGETARPQGMTAADFEKQRSAMSSTFNGVAGFVALKMKDYREAQRYLRASVDSNPDLFSNVYPLALSYLLSEPAQPVPGLFFLARATNLAPAAAARKKLDAYGKEQCVKYYGSDRSWASVKAVAKTHATPPLTLAIDESR